MPSEWREVLDRRNRTSKTQRLYEDGQPTNKYSWGGMVGTSLHYEEAGEWLEVDPRIVPSSEPGWDWQMRKSHWRFLIRNGGWFAAEKQGVGIGFRLERVAYLNIQTKEWQTIRVANYTTPIVEAVPLDNDLLPNPRGKLTWANLFPGVDFEIYTSGDGIHEEIKVSQAARDAMPHPPYPVAKTYLVLVYRVDWDQVPGLSDDDGDIDKDTDFERQARLYLKNHQGEIITALPASRAWPEGEPEDADGEPIEVLLLKRFVKIAGQHYLLVGAPVLALNALPQGTIIFDPDVDTQVGAGADDGYRYYTSTFNSSNAYTYSGYFTSAESNSFHRFTGVSIEGTIDVSYVEAYRYATTAGTPELKVRAVDEDNPDAPTSAAEYDADPVTDAGVDWDGVWDYGVWNQSPSLNTVFQELVNSYTISNDAVIVQLRDDLGTGTNYNKGRSYDYTGNAHGLKLWIEYTAAAAGASIPIIMHHRKMMGVS